MSEPIGLDVDPLPEGARCMECKYLLLGLERPVCPECGRAFMPGDSRTYLDPKTPPRWPLVDGPPSRMACNWMLLIAALYVALSTQPGGLGTSLSLAVCFLVPLALAVGIFALMDFFGRFLAAAKNRRHHADDASRARRHRIRWIIIPLCVSIILSVYVSAWPMRLRFLLSRPALEQAVLKLEAGTTAQSMGGRIGLYDVGRIHPLPGGAYFFVTGWSGFDSIGFVYRPGGPAGVRSETALSGGWFARRF